MRSNELLMRVCAEFAAEIRKHGDIPLQAMGAALQVFDRHLDDVGIEYGDAMWGIGRDLIATAVGLGHFCSKVRIAPMMHGEFLIKGRRAVGTILEINAKEVTVWVDGAQGPDTIPRYCIINAREESIADFKPEKEPSCPVIPK